jgi:hypothetical protein
MYNVLETHRHMYIILNLGFYNPFYLWQIFNYFKINRVVLVLVEMKVLKFIISSHFYRMQTCFVFT